MFICTIFCRSEYNPNTQLCPALSHSTLYVDHPFLVFFSNDSSTPTFLRWKSRDSRACCVDRISFDTRRTQIVQFDDESVKFQDQTMTTTSGVPILLIHAVAYLGLQRGIFAGHYSAYNSITILFFLLCLRFTTYTYKHEHAHKSPHFPPNPCNLFSDISHFESFHLFPSSTLSVSPHLLLFMNSSIRLRPRSSYPPSLFPSVNHGTLILLLLAGDVASWILAHLLWTLLTWILDQSGASRNLLYSTTILLIIPRKFYLSMKHGSNQLTLTMFHLWHLLVIQSCTLLVSLVKVVVLLLFFDHTWNSNFSALATYLHLNLSNFQLATRKPSFLTSIVLHLPKYLLFFRNSRIYLKFLFHHHLSSSSHSSVVTSIFMLTQI